MLKNRSEFSDHTYTAMIQSLVATLRNIIYWILKFEFLEISLDFVRMEF